MAWEWSHTPEAYLNALKQVEALPKYKLLTILREWAFYDRCKTHPNRSSNSFRLPAGLRHYAKNLLATLVWGRMEELRTCDNGGHNAWCCPYGCHTVPFDAPKGVDNAV